MPIIATVYRLTRYNTSHWALAPATRATGNKPPSSTHSSTQTSPSYFHISRQTVGTAIDAIRAQWTEIRGQQNKAIALSHGLGWLATEEYLSLAEVLAAARDVGGQGHHFRAVQVPFNADMTEAAGLRNQAGGRTLLESAADAGVAVFASASLLQGRLAAAQSLQHVRGTRGILCALAGMKTRAHVEENAALAQIEVTLS